MRTTETKRDYRMTIGLDVHMQLKTESKMFCACAAAFGTMNAGGGP